MKISDLSPGWGAKKKEKRVGRGPGSGHGKTSTKGHKGQAARSGGTKAPGFEGGQQPLIRRAPKRGFRPIARKEYAIVNLDQLDRFPANTLVDPKLLYETGIVKKGDIKVLGEGNLDRPLTLCAHQFSASAIEKIQAAGGSIERISASFKKSSKK
jgi:large subunit ribosomal protein L15